MRAPLEGAAKPRRAAAGALLVAVSAIVFACRGPEPPLGVERFEAFARLYGYVRFFHPSDQASHVDWDRLAVYGARRVAAVRDREALRAVLEEIFLPIAPSVRIYQPPETPSPPTPETRGTVPVFWQHEGVDLGFDSPFRSARVHRMADPLALTNTATAYVTHGDFAGRDFRLSAQVRARVDGVEGGNGDGHGGRLFLEALGARNQTYIDEDQRDNLATGSDWHRTEIAGTFTETTPFIKYGLSLAGLGSVCFDDVRFEVADEDGTWSRIEVQNAGFEDVADGVPRLWDFRGHGYRFIASTENPHAGARSGCIESVEGHVVGSLFAAVPEPGETIDKLLGAGLRARIPIAFQLDPQPSEHVASDLRALLDQLEATDLETPGAEDLGVRVAAVSIAWTVLQHFYPYFEEVEVDWDAALREHLVRVIDDRIRDHLVATLESLLAGLEDGHALAYPAGVSRADLDAELAWIEDRLVVTSPDSDGVLEAGDVIDTVDGRDAGAVVAERAERFSGTPRWRRHRALVELTPGDEGSTVALAVDRSGELLEVDVTRKPLSYLPTDDDRPFERLEGGVWYVDLRRADMAEITRRIDDLAAAPGVIFDLRGYPNGNHEVLRHLIDGPVRSAQWRVPRTVHPDRDPIAGYRTSGRWTLDPKAPRIRGKVAFLTDHRAISYAESVMGIVEHHGLGAIVGGPTAGTNGNINALVLPGGIQMLFTGMKVIKHDDSQHHLVGILPTVPVSPTLAGVRAGRDEVLEKALEVVRP